MTTATKIIKEKPLKVVKRRQTPLRWFFSTGWRHIVGIAIVLYAIFPILYIISTSLYPNNSIEGNNTLFAAISFENYISLFQDTARPFATWYFNTVYIGLATSIGSVFISALAAYSFSRLRFRGRRGGLLSLILIQMFPSLLGLVAIYGMLIEIGRIFPAFGLDSQLGLIMIYMGGSLGGGTYLMYGFFNTVPKELDEAAKLDGATHTQIFYGIILRLVAPVLAVQMLLSYIGITSDYVLASVVLSKPESLTLAVGLQQFISDPFSRDWSMFTAGAVLSAIPVVALFMYLQRYIVSGLLGGAVKG
ncbi:MAG: sugar ABC transporter permease [Rhodoluna sp.]|nr:sugar ABC transporter permease [Rhodoluna sp.]